MYFFEQGKHFKLGCYSTVLFVLVLPQGVPGTVVDRKEKFLVVCDKISLFQ
jgi:hypothetical protein